MATGSHADHIVPQAPKLPPDAGANADAAGGTKRKRGRPPNAAKRSAIDLTQATAAAEEEKQQDQDQKQGQEPEQEQEEHHADVDTDVDTDADAEDAGRPSKRGRSLRSANNNGEAEDASSKRGAGRTAPRGKENRPLHDKAGVILPPAPEPAPAPVPDAKHGRGRQALGTRRQREKEKQVSPAVNGAGRRRPTQRTAQLETNGSEEAWKDDQHPVEGRRKRRGERVKHEEPEPEAEPDSEPEQPARRKRRGRPSLQDQRRRERAEGKQQREDEGGEQEREREQEEGQPRLRTRRRPSIQEAVAIEARKEASKSTTRTADSVVEEASGSARKGRRGAQPRLLNEDKPLEEAEKVKGRRSEKPVSERPRHRPPPDDRSKQQEEAEAEAEADDEYDDAPPSPEKPYTHIAPRIHRVRQSDIKAKWSPLGEASLSSILSILHLAQRPILQRLSNTQQRREHTSAALRLVSARITRKIARGLPFPPAAMAGAGSGVSAGRSSKVSRNARKNAGGGGDDGRAAELDFESVVGAKQALERQIDPARHAVDLLRREKARLERELEKDYEVLRNLDVSARSQAREHRALVKKAHVLAPLPAPALPAAAETASRRSEEHGEDGLVLRTQALPGGLFDNLQDGEDDVKEIGLQLGNHMESMRNNLRQTEGILPQLSRSKAALQDVLFRYLDQEHYEHVLFG